MHALYDQSFTKVLYDNLVTSDQKPILTVTQVSKKGENVDVCKRPSTEAAILVVNQRLEDDHDVFVSELSSVCLPQNHYYYDCISPSYMLYPVKHMLHLLLNTCTHFSAGLLITYLCRAC